MSNQVSSSLCAEFEARIASLEEFCSHLRGDLDVFKEVCHKRSPSMEKSHLRAVEFAQELEELSRQVHASADGVADVEKTNGSLPPHLRGASKAVPPHLRGKIANGAPKPGAISSRNSRLVTDGPVDSAVMNKIPAAVPSPPQSPVRSAQEDVEHQLSDLSLFTKKWQPHFLTTLRPLENKVQIPTNAQTFHPQFLADALGGDDWSPGTKFIVAGDHTCIIRNRTYFLVDPATEPYLPAQAGHHGAKLIAFFNKTPEDFHELPEDVTSYENVPMFVKQLDGRFAYFGNYTQARWSDKLDNDTMRARVPQSIKEHWANELTSADRPEWVTKALKTHFFKKPEYEGRLYPEELDASTVTSEVEVKNNERMARDVRKYVEKLREWEREATMKTALIKKQVILDAFDAADADVPPALRLWWEYLECVDWRKDFYDLLVNLQSRDASYMK